MKRVVGVVAGIGMLVVAVGAPPRAMAQIRQDLVWGACDRTGEGRTSAPAAPGVECATLRVPLDYRRPYRTIGIALNRIKGRTPRAGNHLGVLLVNPGGPGASGRDLARYVAAALPGGLADRFDVIGFDPRGVGRSTPALQCVDPGDYYAPPRPDHVPKTAQEESALVGRAREYAEACQARWSWFLPHLTTENSARDMDMIRAALGESRISYLGYSYGTYLGAVYATLFPRRVKRLVLDSVVDPRGIWYASNLKQNAYFDRRHRDFLAWTARNNRVYRLGATVASVSFAWYATRERLRTRPAGGVVGPSEFDDVYTAGGYSDALWPELARAFSAYVRRGDTEPLLAAYRRHAENDAATENGYAVYLATECADAPWPRDWNRWRADTAAVHARAPFMAWQNAWYNAPCAFWPGRGGVPVRIRQDRALPGALLIQSRRDAATPYPGALEMRRILTRSRLVVEGGGDHGVALFEGNRCVDGHLAAYLRDGTLPGRTGRAGAGVDARCAAGPGPKPAARAARVPLTADPGR
ncbi:alpha/beta hydrolase [Planomonospora sp. ID82291]|uniref:alpha/beta hydrolase n=1 Tax=Planomonospora sp. ID82291 TaxID=2738136 RepID=UPI0018C39235|nr:alpha/beta hydrolase [Planomonospora sp. ID82291]